MNRSGTTDAGPGNQTTLLTSHKGVDLHAASAVRVMQDRLESGHLLRSLSRCEVHTFRGSPRGVSVERMLEVGRYFNPNKHHFGHFELESADPWNPDADSSLPVAWPGSLRATDFPAESSDASVIYELLLGGPVPSGATAVDVVSWTRDQSGPVTSGAVWRLTVEGGPQEALAVGRNLAVARSRKQGLLVNPHMESWLAVAR